MNWIIAMLFAYGAVIGAKPEGVVRDSFIRDGVKIADFPTLTAKAKDGKTHYAGQGSGFFITDDGYLLTNHHVIENAAELVVIKDGCAYMADVIAKNAKQDLALLKINLFPRATNGEIVVSGLPRVQPLQKADRQGCQVGQTIYVIGYPMVSAQGLEPKVTRGIVSSMSGFKGETDKFQMDAAIQGGNSGGPVVDEWGRLVGISVSTLIVPGEKAENVNYAIKLDEVVKFLPKSVKMKTSVSLKRKSTEKMIAEVLKSTVLILNYQQGSCGKITESTEADDAIVRENVTEMRKCVLAAKMRKLHREWKELKEITDYVLKKYGEVDEVKEMNDLARDELGLHLVIVAEADGHDVDATIKPICGFKEDFVKCGKAAALYGGESKRLFNVEAILEYEDDEWCWGGELKCRYDWSGTKEIRVVMKKKGKK